MANQNVPAKCAEQLVMQGPLPTNMQADAQSKNSSAYAYTCHARHLLIALGSAEKPQADEAVRGIRGPDLLQVRLRDVAPVEDGRRVACTVHAA